LYNFSAELAKSGIFQKTAKQYGSFLLTASVSVAPIKKPDHLDMTSTASYLAIRLSGKGSVIFRPYLTIGLAK
jgi:hypothetical protein